MIQAWRCMPEAQAFREAEAGVAQVKASQLHSK